MGTGKSGLYNNTKGSTNIQSIIKDGHISIGDIKSNNLMFHNSLDTPIKKKHKEKEIDIFAPIIPFKELGGIKLYSSREELKDILSKDGIIVNIIENQWIRYDIQDSIELFFHLKNNKLFRITTLENYKGKLFDAIQVGTHESDLQKLEPSFIYDDFEETWDSNKGVFIETDPLTNTVKWISIYIPELFNKDFNEGLW